jgi:hypothetical protein
LYKYNHAFNNSYNKKQIKLLRAPDKKRFLNAVNHIEQEEIPLYEQEADMAIVNKMMDKHYDLALHSFELPPEDVVEWNKYIGNDMVYFSHVWHLGRKEKKDMEGRVHYIDGLIKDRATMEDIRLPDIGALRLKMENTLDLIESTGFGLICGAQTTGFTVPTAIGYQDFCLAIYNDPSFVSDFQKRVHEYSMLELEMYLSFPIDAIKIGSGLITSSGPMISPEMMEKYEFQYIQEQCDLIKSFGKKIIFHVDGLITPWIPKFLQLGMDILNPIDPSAEDQDIYQIKREFGEDITLNGNINVDEVLMNGTPEEVREDVIEHMEKLAVGGGYIVASSHDLHQLVPLENIYAMRDAVHNYRFTVNQNKS